MDAKAVIVHGLEEARAALAAAARAGRPVTLLSAPGAAGYAGLGWWRALVAAARAAVPDAEADDVLDCGELAGLAVEALHAGCPAVVFTGPDAQADRLAALAGICGGRLLRAAPAALDLAQPAAFRRLAAWLAAG
jgi:hypothetical protein